MCRKLQHRLNYSDQVFILCYFPPVLKEQQWDGGGRGWGRKKKKNLPEWHYELTWHTWPNFGAEPPLDAILVDVLQTSCASARLNQWVGRRLLSHMANSAQVSFVLIGIFQHQSNGEQGHHCKPLFYCDDTLWTNVGSGSILPRVGQ